MTSVCVSSSLRTQAETSTLSSSSTASIVAGDKSLHDTSKHGDEH
jgi:hypothetical protein